MMLARCRTVCFINSPFCAPRFCRLDSLGGSGEKDGVEGWVVYLDVLTPRGGGVSISGISYLGFPFIVPAEKAPGPAVGG